MILALHNLPWSYDRIISTSYLLLSIRQKPPERLHLGTELPALVARYKYKDYSFHPFYHLLNYLPDKSIYL